MYSILYNTLKIRSWLTYIQHRNVNLSFHFAKSFLNITPLDYIKGSRYMRIYCATLHNIESMQNVSQSDPLLPLFKSIIIFLSDDISLFTILIVIYTLHSVKTDSQMPT